MPGQHRLIFDSSFAALTLANTGTGAERPPTAWRPAPARRPKGGSVTAMVIQFAPEPDPTANVVHLGEARTTGPLRIGFDFEFFGVRYSCFGLSSEGFITFGTDPLHCLPDCNPGGRRIPLNEDLRNVAVLGWASGFACMQVAYEVRGAVQRRRLVLSLTGIPARPEAGVGPTATQLVLHERTGVIDVYMNRHDGVLTRFNRKAVRLTTVPLVAYEQPA